MLTIRSGRASSGACGGSLTTTETTRPVTTTAISSEMRISRSCVGEAPGCGRGGFLSFMERWRWRDGSPRRPGLRGFFRDDSAGGDGEHPSVERVVGADVGIHLVKDAAPAHQD